MLTALSYERSSCYLDGRSLAEWHLRLTSSGQGEERNSVSPGVNQHRPPVLATLPPNHLTYMDSQGKAGGRVGFAVVEGLAVPQRRCSSSTAVNPPPIHDTLGLLYSGFAHVGRGVALGREHQSQQPSLTPVKWKDAAFAWQGSTSLSNDHHVFMSLSTSVSQQNRCELQIGSGNDVSC